MDVKTIGLIFLGSFLIQASIFGVAADKVPDKDGEVPKLVKAGNHLEETAAVRGLSLKNMLLQKRSINEDIKENKKKQAGMQCEWVTATHQKCWWSRKEDNKENRQKHAGKVQTRQEDKPCCYISGGTLYCNCKEDIKESRQKRAAKQDFGPGCHFSGGTLYCNGKADIKESRQKRAGKAQTRQKGCGWNCGWCMHGICLDGKLSQ